MIPIQACCSCDFLDQFPPNIYTDRVSDFADDFSDVANKQGWYNGPNPLLDPRSPYQLDTPDPGKGYLLSGELVTDSTLMFPGVHRAGFEGEVALTCGTHNHASLFSELQINNLPSGASTASGRIYVHIGGWRYTGGISNRLGVQRFKNPATVTDEYQIMYDTQSGTSNYTAVATVPSGFGEVLKVACEPPSNGLFRYYDLKAYVDAVEIFSMMNQEMHFWDVVPPGINNDAPCFVPVGIRYFADNGSVEGERVGEFDDFACGVTCAGSDCV